MKLSFIFSLLIIPIVQAFVPNVYLSGTISESLRAFAIPKSVAFKYIQRCQIEAIKNNKHVHICSELDSAREILRDPTKQDYHASFITPKKSGDVLFTVIYRMSDTFPTLYTLEALIRNHERPIVSSDEMLTILNQMIKCRRGIIQLYPLKQWMDGRYIKESKFERSFAMGLD